MYWAAFGDVSMPEAAPFYFVSRSKRSTVSMTSRLPDTLFQGIMVVPPAERRLPKGYKKKVQARKGKNEKIKKKGKARKSKNKQMRSWAR